MEPPTPTPPNSHSPATLISVAKTYLSIFSTFSPSTLAPLLSPTYAHIFAPSSLAIPPRNLTTFTSHIANMGSILKSFPVRAKEIWPNPYLNQVTIWADSETMFHDHVKDIKDGGEEEWRYRGEYVFVLNLDAEGRVERVMEFLDSDGSKRLLGLMKRAREKVGLGKGDGLTTTTTSREV